MSDIPPSAADALANSTSLHDAPIALAQMTGERRFVAINNELAKLLDVSPEIAAGADPAELLPPETAAFFFQPVPELSSVWHMARVPSPGHHFALRDWQFSLVRGGNENELLFLIEDVTERLEFQRRLLAERSVARGLARAENLDDGMRAALRGILESFELRFCEFWSEVEDGLLSRRILASANPDDEQQFRASPLVTGEGLIGLVYATKEPVHMRNVATHPDFRRAEAAAALRLQSAFAFPVMVEDDCLGVISMFADQQLDIGESLTAVLTRLGQEIGQFIRRTDTHRHARENEARTAMVIESALDAVITIDERGVILRWNPRAEEVFGWSRGEAIGSNLAELIIPPQLRDAHHTGMQHFLETGEGPVLNKRIEITAIRRNGDDFPVELTVLPLKLAKRYEFTAYIRDITERKQAEEALLEADRRKTEFLAVLGHELRNPLATISNAIELIVEHQASGEEMAQLMRPQVKQLRHLLDDLLDLTRINHGKIALNRKIISLRDAVNSAADAVQPLLQQHEQTLRAALDAIDTLEIYADRTRVQQILTNLLTNASKYSPDGGEIRLSVQVAADEVILAIEDDGDGIPADKLEHIFEAFTQLRDDGGESGGLGIGLTLVQMLTEMHDGTVSASSGGPGKGSRFEVRLPTELPEDAQRSSPAAGQVMPTPGLDVLIIDDNETSATTLAQLLAHSAQCETRVAFDGETGLAAAYERVPDAMIVDIQLPDMSGLDIASSISTDARFANTRLIALSGFGHQEAVADALAAGFQHHLSKPVDLPRLLARLNQP